MAQRDLKWEHEELILALDCYLKVRDKGRRLRPSDEEAQELSNRLQALRMHPTELRPASFRSKAAVAMQVNGFSEYDDQAPFKARSTGGSRNEKVWRTYSSEPEAARIMANAI